MNKRKILSILALGLLVILIIMTSVPIRDVWKYSQWSYLFFDLEHGYSFAVIFDIIFMIVSLVLATLSFFQNNRAKLFITLSVLATWLAGTIIGIEMCFFDIFWGSIPIICYLVLCAPVFIWNLVLKDIPSDEETKGELAKESAKDKKRKSEKAAVSTGDPDSPVGKTLDWFCSEKGMEVYKIYLTPQNYMLEESLRKKYEEKCPDHVLDFDKDFVPIFGKDAKLPHAYFGALVKNIDVDAMQYKTIRDLLIAVLEQQAKPFTINADGEPEARNLPLAPQQIVSVVDNPILYFVKNFDVFKIEDDDMGEVNDKYHTYAKALMFVGSVSDEIVMEENKWLFYRDTYVNDFGLVRKEKGFLKKCIECTDNNGFRALLATMLDNVDSWNAQRAQEAAAAKQAYEQRQQAYEQRQQAEEQRKQAEEQKKLVEKQMDEQRKNAQMMACAASQCPVCNSQSQCGMKYYSPDGNGRCRGFTKKI